MVDLFPEGFEESHARGGEIELAAYTTCGREERLRALGPVSATPVEAGWEHAWKRFHRPMRVGALWVGPPREVPDSGSVAVAIDPGRAFGTGAHATTRLCLEFLVELKPSSLVDLGCGSGVLAIAAAKLGFAPVVALDSDEAAVQATRANSAANQTAVEARRADVLADRLPVADVALANIALPVVERLGERRAAEHLVSSGYLVGAEPQLPSWRLLERREAEGWVADLLMRRELGFV
jgi:ribosomal protein L11 methyltransferase